MSDKYQLQREAQRKYHADVVCEVYMRGGNPDAISDDCIDDCYWNGRDSQDCADDELRRQRRRRY
jgi:hypothetical protein